MSFTKLIFSSTITPPIPQGQRLRFAEMAYITDKINPQTNMVIINKDGPCHGIFTHSLAECMAVTIVEKDAKGNINDLLMIHYGGGFNTEKLDALMEILAERKLEPDGSRECIVTPGFSYDSAEDYVEKYITPNNMDDYLHQEKYASLAFREKCKYIHTKQGSTCITFEGYAGPFYDNPTWVTTKDEKTFRDYTVGKPNIHNERAEFEKIITAFKDSNEMKNLAAAIESIECERHTKAKLYFHTRKFIFDTHVKESKPGEKNTQIKTAIKLYKNSISGLPIKTDPVLNAVINLSLNRECSLSPKLFKPTIKQPEKTKPPKRDKHWKKNFRAS